MNNKGRLILESERLNAIRGVLQGKVSSNVYFHTIRGDVLVSGAAAANTSWVSNVVCSYIERNDMPNIILTSHFDVITSLENTVQCQMASEVVTSYGRKKNYHLFYGMSTQQLLHFIRMTADEMGYGGMTGDVMLFASAVLDVVITRYPVSLPAMENLLRTDDESIADLAQQAGLSTVLVNNIRGNHTAGVALRRVLERLDDVFADIYMPECDTRYNLQSGARNRIPAMVVYSESSNQRIFNMYMKEELFSTLRRVSKVRVILDEMNFQSADDDLLNYLMQEKRQGKIELVIFSQNVKETSYEKSSTM